MGTAAAIVGGSVVSGLLSKSASDKQAKAAREAGQLSDAQFQQTRSDLAPWRAVGGQAVRELGALYNLPYANPGQPGTVAINQDGTPDNSTPQNMLAVPFAGRNGDTTLGHLTPGETVVPGSVSSQPGVRNALMVGFNQAGISPDQYTVGGPNSVNPRTGLREFADYGMSGQDYGGFHGDISGGNYGNGNPRDAFGGNDPYDRLRQRFAGNALAQPAPQAPVVQQPADYYTQQNAIDRFYQSPDYKLAFDEGQKALESSAAARGGLFSGNTGVALTKYGQQLGGNLYGQYYNRLANLAGLGQTATTATGQFGAQAAGYGGNALIAGGNARAAGYEGIGNAINSGISNYLLYNYLGQ